MLARTSPLSALLLCTLGLAACDSPLTPSASLPAAPSTPSAVTTACPNEPAGWTVISDRHFLPLATPKVTPLGKEYDAGWSSTGAFSIVSDPTAPDGDGYVGQEKYGITNRVGSGTMASYLTGGLKGKGYTGLYTCYMMKVDPNYIGEASGSNKQFWFQVGTSNENRVIGLLHIPGPNITGKSNTWLAMRYQDLDNVGPTMALFKPALTVSRGVWHRFEMQAQLESSKGAADGWIKTYTDGQLATTTTALRFTHPGEALEWYSVKWNNTYGGGSSFCMNADPVTGLKPTQAAHPECFVPHTQYVWTDAQRVLAH